MEREIIVDKMFHQEAKLTQNEELESSSSESESEEEALSLCDLPNKEETIKPNQDTPEETKSTQDEFDFCSFSKESEMCSADQVFFQGQILPLRNSISTETVFLPSTNTTTATTTKYLTRSESMDTYSYTSTGFTSRGSSRSSSIRSSTSTSTSTRSSVSTPVYKPSSFNNFNSHPSPKPHIKTSRIKNQTIQNPSQKSRTWSLFRLGLLTTPEIVLDDLKHRSINNNTINKHKNSFQKSRSFGDTKSKKKKQGIFEVNGTIFSTCKCSSSAIVTIPSKMDTTERSVGAKMEFVDEERKGSKQQEEGKQSISRHRTFEWLKQLSLESTSNVRNDA